MGHEISDEHTSATIGSRRRNRNPHKCKDPSMRPKPFSFSDLTAHPIQPPSVQLTAPQDVSPRIRDKHTVPAAAHQPDTPTGLAPSDHSVNSGSTRAETRERPENPHSKKTITRDKVPASMPLPPPLPGLQNVLRSSSSISYLSSTSHILLPSITRPPVLVHALHDRILAYATDHVFLESPAHNIRLSQRLHFRPTHLAVHANAVTASVVVAGADGALFAAVDLANGEVENVLHPLPGSSGYITVNVALNETFIAAAAIDGRVALWRNPDHPACHIIDIPPLSSDRVTDLAFINDALLIAWWSGRLLLYDLRNHYVVWDCNAVTVSKDIFGSFPGCFVTIKDSIVALSTGRGDLVFVRLDDGAHFVTKVGKYIKGMCDHHNKLNFISNGSLITHEWMPKHELDQSCIPKTLEQADKEQPATEKQLLDTG